MPRGAYGLARWVERDIDRIEKVERDTHHHCCKRKEKKRGRLVGGGTEGLGYEHTHTHTPRSVCVRGVEGRP
jgi:hypothetical protein